MKKILCVFASFTILILLLVGCNSSAISKMTKEPLMNGIKTKQIGEYGQATYNPDKLTDEDLLKFYNDNVKNSGLNFVLLVNKDDKSQGIAFPGCNNIITYGTISDDGTGIDSSYKTRFIEGDKIVDNIDTNTEGK